MQVKQTLTHLVTYNPRLIYLVVCSVLPKHMHCLTFSLFWLELKVKLIFAFTYHICGRGALFFTWAPALINARAWPCFTGMNWLSGPAAAELLCVQHPAKVRSVAYEYSFSFKSMGVLFIFSEVTHLALEPAQPSSHGQQHYASCLRWITFYFSYCHGSAVMLHACHMHQAPIFCGPGSDQEKEIDVMLLFASHWLENIKSV